MLKPTVFRIILNNWNGFSKGKENLEKMMKEGKLDNLTGIKV